MVAFKSKKINHPRDIKPHKEKKQGRKRAVNVGVSGVIHDIIHKHAFAHIPYRRAYKRSKGEHFERAFGERA